MPRNTSSRSTSRSSATSAFSPKSKPASNTAPQSPQTNQVAKPAMGGMGSGIMGSLVSGMAFGAGAEMVRGLFRSSSGENSVGESSTQGSSHTSYVKPFLLGSASAALTYYLMRQNPRVKLFSLAACGGVFFLTK